MISAAAARGAAAEPAATRLAQLPRYTASGIHQCGAAGAEGRSCVVTGLFSDCNEAAISLRLRDCCPDLAGGGKSREFNLAYCIPVSR